jgi:hypothetical protein
MRLIVPRDIVQQPLLDGGVRVRIVGDRTKLGAGAEPPETRSASTSTRRTRRPKPSAAEIERQLLLAQLRREARDAVDRLHAQSVKDSELRARGAEIGEKLDYYDSLTPDRLERALQLLRGTHEADLPPAKNFAQMMNRLLARDAAGRAPDPHDPGGHGERLLGLFRAAGATDRQAWAWTLGRLGVDQPEIGRHLNPARPVGKSTISELVSKAEARILAYRVGKVSGKAVADRIVSEHLAYLANRGPHTAAELAAAHGDGTGVARSVSIYPAGDMDKYLTAPRTRKGAKRRSK